MMELLNDMALFVEVVKARNFRGAAETLGIPNSTLSRRISLLEKAIGLRLLNRTTRGIELTEAGQVKVPLTEIVIDAEVDLHLAGNDDCSLSARLNVGLPGVGRQVAEQLVKDAEQLCPYSKATQGNIDVAIEVI
jgi:DNA-binding transcriptional LysR family regulator